MSDKILNINEPLSAEKWYETIPYNQQNRFTEFSQMEAYASYRLSFRNQIDWEKLAINFDIKCRLLDLSRTTQGDIFGWFKQHICRVDTDNSLAFGEWMDIHTRKITHGLYKLWLWGDNVDSPAKTQGGLFTIGQLHQYFKDGKK